MSRVELWVERRGGRPAVNPVMAALLDLLGRLGHDVAVVVPEDRLVADGSAAGCDLVLLKTTTPAALAAAAVAQAGGTPVLNDAAASVAMADKAFALARVAAAGVPVPATLLLPDDGLPGTAVPLGSVPPVRDAAGSWVRKPVGGVHGWGVGVHAGLADALGARTDTSGAPAGAVRSSVLVQEHVGGSSTDVKVYAVRGTLFAGRKAFSASSFSTDDVEPVELTASEREACATAGEACGLVLYGVDLRRDPGGGSTVVDVNAFPGYRGFPAAVPALADVVLDALGRSR